MSSIIPSDINYTTNNVIQFNNKNVPWAINIDEIIHDITANNRENDYSDSSLNKLNIISKQKDIDISSADKINLTAFNEIIFNSESSFNNLATFKSIKTNDISCNNIIYSNKINNLNNSLDIFSTDNIDISSTNNLNLTASNNIIFNSESSFNNLAKFTDVSIKNLSITNDLSINNQLQINNTIIKSNIIKLDPGLTNEINLFDKFKFILQPDDNKYNILLQTARNNSGGKFIISTLVEDRKTVSGEDMIESTINSTTIGFSKPDKAIFTDVSISNLSISNDLYINELSLNILKSYEIYLNKTDSDNSINLIIELSNIDNSLNQLNTNISNLDTSMESKFQITDTSVNSLESQLNNFILNDASFGRIDISKNIKLEYIDNNHSLLFVDNNKDLSSNNFIHFNELSGIMFFDNSFAMKIPHSIENTSHDISGLIRYNTNTNKFEGYNGSIWNKFLDTTNNKIDILDNGDISFNKIYLHHNTGDISCVNLYNNYIKKENVLIENDLSINNTLHINNHIIKNEIENSESFLVIDPQPAGNEKGTLKIKGNLIVDGSQTIIHSTRVDISDTNINLGIDAQNKSDLNDAGIDISDVARFRYNYNNDKWNTNIGLNISGDLDVSNINVNNINNVSFNDLSNIVTQLDNSCIKFDNIPEFPGSSNVTNRYLSVSGGIFEWKEVTLEGSIGSTVNGLQTNIDNSFDDVYIKSYIDLSFNDVYNKNYIDTTFQDVYNKSYIDTSIYTQVQVDSTLTSYYLKSDVEIQSSNSSISINNSSSYTLNITFGDKLYSYTELPITSDTTINTINNSTAASNFGQQIIINIKPSSDKTVTLNGKSTLNKVNNGNAVYINFEDDIICNGSNKESILITACTPYNNTFIINACLLYEL